METYRQSTVVCYDVSVHCDPAHDLSLPSHPPSSPSPAKFSFHLVRETLKYIRNGDQGPYERLVDDGSEPSVESSSTSFDVEFVQSGSFEFYHSVFRSMESLGVEDEAIPRIVDSIVDVAEKKLSEINPHQNFIEILVRVDAKRTDLISLFDTPAAFETARREWMQENQEANKGMVPACEKSKKTMLKRITVTGEEGCSESKACNRHTCVICQEDILVGSRATQVPCSHVFHSDCIEEWLGVSHFCPICRLEFPAKDEINGH